MSKEIFSRKLSAFLHDPLDKPFILMQGENHEERAKKLADKIGISLDFDPASDHIASAMERSFLPKGVSWEKNLQVRFLERPCIKHPLSGKKFDKATELRNVDKQIFKTTIDKAFSEISDTPFKDVKELYFYLWRNLLPLIEKNSPPNIKKFWSLAPSDTRIPDHSIFEHLKVSSACSNSTYVENSLLNNCSLFLFTLGPVQSFIAQARKTQDLYWGSFILSYLNWKAIEIVAERYGPDCIMFPDIQNQPFADWWLKKKGLRVVNSNSPNIMTPTIPNRFLAIVPQNGKERLYSLGDEIEDKTKKEFKNIVEQILKSLELPKPEGLGEQIENFLQIYWIFVPWFRDENGRQDWEAGIEKLAPYFNQQTLNNLKDILEFGKASGQYRPNTGNIYPLLFSFAEKALQARKNTREFEQLEERGRKCSLCGERNILFYKKMEKEQKNKTKEYLRAKKLFNDSAEIFNYGENELDSKYLQAGEGLCAVCFTKRCAEKIKNNDIKEFAELKCLLGAHYDPALLYGENLTEDYFKKYNIPSDKLEKAKKLQKSILGWAENRGIKQSKYYAVLMLDGDDMGKWLSGEKAPNIKDTYHPEVWKNLPEEFRTRLSDERRQMTPAIHSAISLSLRDYSLRFVRKIVEEERSGRLVYSGGDDVLAFLNLDDLLSVMVKLRASFSGHINKDLQVDFTKDVDGFVELEDRVVMTMGPEATASMGVCIAHYKTPLAVVLSTAREMEKKAKEIPGKDAFAISTLKHSGEVTEASFKWRCGDDAVKEEGTISTLKRLVDELKKGKKREDEGFSDKFIYNLNEEFKRLAVKDRLTIWDGIIKAEIKRLLSRSCQMKGRTDDEKRKKKRTIEELAEGLFQTYIDSKSFKNFASLLNIAVFLTRESAI